MEASQTFVSAPYVTHHEVEGFLGGGRRGGQQRRRLTKRGWLPTPKWLRVDRDQLGVLPDFVLAALAVPSRGVTSQQVRLLEAVAKETDKLFGSKAFSALAEALSESLKETQSERVVDLTRYLIERDRSVLDAWRADVVEVTSALSPLGLGFESLAARVVKAKPNLYVVQFVEAHDVEDFPREGAPYELADGDWVIRDRVRAATAARDFLLPAPETQVLASTESAPDQSASHDDHDEALVEMFSGFSGSVREVPALGIARMEEPATSSTPSRVSVDLPMEMLRGASTMARADLN